MMDEFYGQGFFDEPDKTDKQKAVLTVEELDDRDSYIFHEGYKTGAMDAYFEVSKKFAERLKEKANEKLKTLGWRIVDCDDIDEVCKEMINGCTKAN